jgi:hypothetical protein
VASRDYTRHTVTTTGPSGSTRLGDEYFNPLSNTLYKLVAVNGNSPTFNQVLVASANGVAVIANASIASMQVVGNATVGGNVYAASRVGFTWSNSTSASYQVFNSGTGSVDTYFA